MRRSEARTIEGMARRALRRWDRRRPEFWPAVAAALGRALGDGTGARVVTITAAAEVARVAMPEAPAAPAVYPVTFITPEPAAAARVQGRRPGRARALPWTWMPC